MTTATIGLGAIKAYLVLHILAVRAGSDYAPIDYEQIARITELSTAKAQDAVKELSITGWVKPVKSGIVYGPFPRPEPRTKPHLNYGPEWPMIREAILERDNKQCKGCGSTTDLIVHHIWPFRDWGTHDPSNLITLCSKCHARTHRRLGR